MKTCPFCGSKETHPVEDGWWCQDCDKEHPTGAYKCRHTDCWEFAYDFGDDQYCDRHKQDALNQNPTPSRTKRSEFGVPWFLVVLLAAWGTIFGLLSDSFVKGFLGGVLPPLAIGFGFAIYALSASRIIRKLGWDPSEGVFGIALFLSFIFVVIPICVILARAVGLPIRW